MGPHLSRLREGRHLTVEDAVRLAKSLLEAGEPNAASDVITDAEHCAIHKIPCHFELPGGLPRYPAEEFAGMLPALRATRNPFNAAMETWDPTKGNGKAKWLRKRQETSGKPCPRLGVGGDESPVEAATALGQLLKWLGFWSGKPVKVAYGASGGVPFRWRIYTFAVELDPPVPAWVPGKPEKVSVPVWAGFANAPGHLAEAVSDWAPGPRTVPLVMALTRLTSGWWGHL
ncbi:MAG: hypothetical protein LBR80_08170 [Deltaproteobacteria bacterium]|nr:hypothetical protein [Deltaproteobacteria bacterium]